MNDEQTKAIVDEILRDAGYASNGDRPDDEPFRLDTPTARDVCRLPDPPESDQLLGPLIRRGQRLVVGAGTGEGKTTLVGQSVAAVVDGRDFLDWRGHGDSRALIIDAEQGLRTIKRRLREARLDESTAVTYVRVPDGLNLDRDQRHIEEIERILAAGRYDLVVADPLYKLHTGDSNDERAAVDLMRRFDAWRVEHNFGLILPCHIRKPPPGAKFTLNEFFGSSAYLRGAEVVIGLQLIRDGYSRLSFFKDRDGDLPTAEKWGLLFDRETGFRRDPNDGKPSTKDRLAELRKADPTITKAQAAEALGVAVRTVSRHWKADADDAPFEDDQ